MDRHIVARFLYHCLDEVHVLKNANKLQGKPYWIHEQFPNEIKDKRRLLYPNTKTCRKAGQRTKIVKDWSYFWPKIWLCPKFLHGLNFGLVLNLAYTKMFCLNFNFIFFIFGDLLIFY